MYVSKGNEMGTDEVGKIEPNEGRVRDWRLFGALINCKILATHVIIDRIIVGRENSALK